MVLTWIWVGMVGLALIFGAANGSMAAVSAAALEGAQGAVTLCLSIAGSFLLWCGVMEVLQQSGLNQRLSRLLTPILRHILPRACKEPDTLSALCGNVCANLLGLGNAATPLGIRAAAAMAAGCGGVADDELCRLVVLNTASIQLLPTTVAALRGACGSMAPFDILPAVWVSSLCSVSAGLLAARLLGKVWK